MCGIFGISVKNKNKYNPREIEKFSKILFKLSESRGKEAAGLAVKTKETIDILKTPFGASRFLKTPQYKKFSEYTLNNKNYNDFLTIIGHSRLATHGTENFNKNNQPLVKENIICVHNGIIANDKDLWKKFRGLKKETDSDTEILAGLLNFFLLENNSICEAVKKTFKEIEGSVSMAAIFRNNSFLLLSTNTGSLYTLYDKIKEIFLFASEKYILEQFIKKISYGLKKLFDPNDIQHILPQKSLILGLKEFKENSFYFNNNKKEINKLFDKSYAIKLIDHSQKNNLVNIIPTEFKLKPETKKAMMEIWENIYSEEKIKRCLKCLYPETMPFIEFDEKGICNYCKNHKKIEPKGKAALENIISKYRRNDKKPDCIVPFSGGRDSAFGLHYIKKVLNMNPVAYTYDWGVLTDLGRRNQARVCGKLGVEHIIISADIRKKRANIRRNLFAWLKKPELGLIPILMAGDKQLLYYAEKLKKRVGVDLLIYSCGNVLEDEPFKAGFAGINMTEKDHRLPDLSLIDKLKLAKYYAFQYIKNPSYLNKSLLDSVFGFWSLFLLPEKNIHLFDYIKWNEKEILSLITKEYNWELEKDTKATWRIDDGTAPFYNYIYMTVAGFTEFDTFRSGQIREGQIKREEAYELIKEENKPRFDSIEWYAKIIGFNPNQVIFKINSIPRLYNK